MKDNAEFKKAQSDRKTADRFGMNKDSSPFNKANATFNTKRTNTSNQGEVQTVKGGGSAKTFGGWGYMPDSDTYETKQQKERRLKKEGKAYMAELAKANNR